MPLFRDAFEAMMAYDMGKIGLHDKIRVRIPHPIVKDKSGEKRYEKSKDGNPMHVIETTAAGASSTTSCPRACRSTT